MRGANSADRIGHRDDARRLEELQFVMREFERSLAHLTSLTGDHAGNALLNLALGKLLEQHGRAATVTLFARIVEELRSNTLPDSPEHAVNLFRLDA